MLVGPSDIDDNFRLGPINRSPTADRVSGVIFGPKRPCAKQYSKKLTLGESVAVKLFRFYEQNMLQLSISHIFNIQ